MVTCDAERAIDRFLEWLMHYDPIKLRHQDQLSKLHGWRQSKQICWE
jgi:hypothetical protein